MLIQTCLNIDIYNTHTHTHSSGLLGVLTGLKPGAPPFKGPNSKYVALSPTLGMKRIRK